MELYVHIPFCVKKCHYCDFLSFPGYGCGADERHRSLSLNYIDALCRELDRLKDWMVLGQEKEIGKTAEDKEIFGKPNVRISSIFIGGGTPSVLSLKESETLLKKLSDILIFSGLSEAERMKQIGDSHSKLSSYCQAFYLQDGISRQKAVTDLKTSQGADIEFTVECNPGTISKDKLLLYKKYGVNRLSIGLQSTENSILSALGRIHTYEEFLESFRLARSLGFDNINIDLISAVPGQTFSNWKETLEKVVELKPEHISAYSLIIEEGTPLYNMYSMNPEALNLPDEETEREIYHFTKSFLREKGYHRYEISNYAKPGYECRHNIGYWTGEEYIGAGLGAASYLSEENAGIIKQVKGESGHNETDENVDADGELGRMKCEKMLRIKNTENILEYISYFLEAEKKESLSTPIFIKEEELDDEDLMAEFCILGLRMTQGISMVEFGNRFGVGIREKYGEIIDKYIREGLLEESDNMIRFTEKGQDLSNVVLCEFLDD